MAEGGKAYIKQHIWNILQTLFGGCCLGLAWLEHRARSVSQSPDPTATTQGGAVMAQHSAMPWYLWIGITALSLSVMIPAVIRLFRKKPDASLLAYQLAACEDVLRRERSQSASDLDRAQKGCDHETHRRKKAEMELQEFRAKAGIFSEFQLEAMTLATDILSFIEGLGPSPAPKYSWQEISMMPESIYRPMIESGDVDYADACEYYAPKSKPYVRSYFPGPIGRSLEAVRAKFALTDLGERVEIMRNRFGARGMDKEAENLALPVEGRFGRENAECIAATLWDLAYKVREKGKR